MKPDNNEQQNNKDNGKTGEINQAHDRFFRSIMTDPKVIREFFEINLPVNVRNAIDLGSIVPQKDSFIDDHLRLQTADMLFSVEFGKQPGYLYLLVEHQSSPDKFMAFRILKYMIAIMEKHVAKTKGSKLPLVYPVVIYNGWKNYSHSTDIFDLFEDDKKLAQDILWQPFKLIDLSTISDDKLKASLWYGVAGYVMKHIFEKDFLPALKETVKYLRTIEKYGENSYIYTVLSYIVEASEIKTQDFINVVKTGLITINEEKIMTLAEQWREEGRQETMILAEQWKREGVERGKLEALKTTAVRLLDQGLDIDRIADITGLSVSEITVLRKHIVR